MSLLSFQITITSNKRATMTDVDPSTSFLSVLNMYVNKIKEGNSAFDLGAAATAYNVVVHTTGNRVLSCGNTAQPISQFMTENRFTYGETIKSLNFQLNPVGNASAGI